VEAGDGGDRDRVAPRLLVPVTGPRALLPVAVADVTTEPLALEDGSGRKLARLLIESTRVGAPGAVPEHVLPPSLLVLGGRRSDALAALLGAMPDLAPAPEDALAPVLVPLGRRPRDYTGKVRVALDPALPAGEAARAILRHLLETMERNLPGLREDLDPEFLHDFRVAVRRTRSALGQLEGVLPAPTVARFTREFRWLQETTGPTRDLDVYVLELPSLQQLLPGGARRSLGPLARLLARRRLETHRGLVRDLDGPRFARLLAGWRAFLARPSPRRPRGAPNALRPVHALAAERIGKLFRRALREGGAITAASPAADLHELRKTCKKLRYLLEFFQSLLDRDEVGRVVESLKGLQDNLGRHQDLQIQVGELLGFARVLAREGRARPPAYLAMGMLVERLREQQAAERQAFAARFEKFARKRNRRRMKRLLARRAPSLEGGGRDGPACLGGTEASSPTEAG